MIPLDPPLAELAARIRAAGAPPPFSGTPAEARARLANAILADRARSTRPVVGAIEDHEAVADHLRVPVRVYRPTEHSMPSPTLLFFHGGGFVLGSVELMDDIARTLCRDVAAVVVSVEYRLAPEHPFPAAHDDAVAATSWVVENVATLGGDPGRIALVGESAGANLAASTALVMRDRRIAIAAQMLIVPDVDMARALPPASTVADYPMLGYADLADITRLYLGQRVAEAAHAPPSPLRAASHAGLPSAVIAVAGHDPLLAEGLAYASRLTASGISVRLHRFDDLFHPFIAFTTLSPAARRACDALCAELAQLLADPAAVPGRV